MDFHLDFTPKTFSEKIAHRHKIFLAGSCFTEHIGAKLEQHKFTVLENPNGILFNSASLTNSIINYIDKKIYAEEELFQFNELWTSWDHHSKFSSVDKEECLNQINESQKVAHAFLQTADWAILTLGSAFVYELTEESQKGRIVANCHKVLATAFNRRLLGLEEVLTQLDGLIYRLKKCNHKLKIIFTISPVRHLREGLVENNRSKATLIQAVHQVVDKFEGLYYFPAYELVIDDLRDYRFYAEDLVHPNYAATNYVWEKFVQACLDPKDLPLMKELHSIYMAIKHKPFNETSSAHQLFIKTNKEKILQLKKSYPYLNLENELNYFTY